ncbi:CHASE4 domain-containing protein [Synechococcus sp. PCC 7336]|uniref:CHASE4 domain-containing protein n=1 Tax=Synechococcus sp. PCC 7336 TaxID=195250 RepID=UPI00034D5431|nr:CHASE4 domain-containing protein [Synechococcus sp. PCC 7336]
MLSIVGTAFGIIFLGQFAIARFILLDSYVQLEVDKARVDAARIQNALDTKLAQLDGFSRDYAAWDDTYDFVESGNPAYMQSNVVDSTFIDGELNVLIVANRSGELPIAAGFDLEAETRVPPPPELIQLAAVGHPLFVHPDANSSHVGILPLSEGLMLVASQPVLTSNYDGPVRGAFIVGRWLDSAAVSEVSEMTELPVSLHRYYTPGLAPNPQAIAAAMDAENEGVAVQILDGSTIASYASMRDLSGQPALMLSAQTPRRIYERGRASLTYYFWSTLCIGLVLCGVALLLLEKLVLARLTCLSQGVSEIGTTARLDQRLLLSGRDELASLAGTINQSLDRLEHSQRALQESEERYALSVRGANDGVWDWNLRSGELYLSPRGKSLLGYGDDEIGDRPEEWFQRVHPQDIERVKSAIAAHQEGQTDQFESEYRIRHKHGSYRWVLCRGVAVRAESGEPERMAGSLTDITDRKLVADLLARQASELKRSNQELEQFASVASHDLQEPLRKIQAFGDRLHRKFSSELGERGRDYLNRMQEASQRMQTLIQDLLACSQVTTNAQPFALVSLEDIVKAVLSNLEECIQQTDATVEVGPLPDIEAEPFQMRQLFQNLIGNALKFSQPGQPPEIAVKSEIVAVESQGEEAGRDICRIWVEDNGIGFDEQYRERIFEMFQRLHGRSHYPGTGIGLAVCRKIVERHSGTISARSQPNRGATFTLTLPMRQPLSDPFS